MAITTYANMQIVPEKFSEYILNRTTDLNTLVRSGIATPDTVVGRLINGTPQGGKFIMMPQYNALEGDDDVFSENDVTVENVTTDAAHATLLIRQKAWGATDLSHVLGGSDPMGAIGNLISDWWLQKEQAIYLSVLKGILDKTSGALKDHVNDISGKDGASAFISQGATLDTKQLLGDHYSSLGMVFLHSAVYTYLQKQDMISRTPMFNPAGDTVEIQTYLGYNIIVDDGMPVNDGVYDTYFLGRGAFIRQDGVPSGLITTETDRDKFGAKDYLINRRAMVIHPRGLSFNTNASFPSGIPYATNAMLADPTNWSLKTHHKRVPVACLRHKIDL